MQGIKVPTQLNYPTDKQASKVRRNRITVENFNTSLNELEHTSESATPHEIHNTSMHSKGKDILEDICEIGGRDIARQPWHKKPIFH